MLKGENMKGDVECCDYMHVHQELIDRLMSNMPDEDILADLSELFKVFGDSTRTRILYALSVAEMCVCDIAALLGIAMNGIPFFYRKVEMPDMNKER